MGSSVLITDFDGTLTPLEFYELAVPRFLPANATNYWALYSAGCMTHFEAMQGIFSQIRCSEDSLHDLLRRLDPGADTTAAAARLRAQGWDLVVVSAGCRWYIDRVLRDSRIEATVHANPGRFEPGGGLIMERPSESPFFCAEHGVDKAAVVRHALASRERVAFAGNGRPDLPAALEAPAARRFATGWLAQELTRRGVPFRRFRRWPEVATALLEEST